VSRGSGSSRCGLVAVAVILRLVGRVAAGVTILLERLRGEHGMAAQIEESRIVLGLARESHVTLMIHLVVLKITFRVTVRLSSPRNSQTVAEGDGREGDGSESEDREHRE